MTRFIQTVFGMTFGLMATFTSAEAATIAFAGEVDIILENNATSDLNAVTVGTPVTGEIDDETAFGFISSALGTVSFTCCDAAGLIEVGDDQTLDSDEADLLNLLAMDTQFAEGDVLDVINIEGDTDSDAGRIEVGLSFILQPDAVASEDPSGYPFDPDDLLLTLFFVLQEDGDNDIFDALGVVDDLTLPFAIPDDPSDNGVVPTVIPLPATGVLLLFGLGLLRGVGKVRRQL